MRILLIFSLIILLSSCATVKVAKEVTKASKSIGTSFNNILDELDTDSKNKNIQNQTTDNMIIEQEIKKLKKEKEETDDIIKKQKKITKINFLNKTSDEIQNLIGEPKLIRTDGNTKIFRFDNNFCQLFVFSNAKVKNSKIEYFEIRNKNGNLIINKEKIDRCYKYFKLV